MNNKLSLSTEAFMSMQYRIQVKASKYVIPCHVTVQSETERIMFDIHDVSLYDRAETKIKLYITLHLFPDN